MSYTTKSQNFVTLNFGYLYIPSIILISPGPSLPRGDGEEEMDQGVLPGDEEDTPPPVPPELITRIACCLEELKKCIEEAPHTTVSLLIER